jgi:hypothetical protein
MYAEFVQFMDGAANILYWISVRRSMAESLSCIENSVERTPAFEDGYRKAILDTRKFVKGTLMGFTGPK